MLGLPLALALERRWEEEEVPVTVLVAAVAWLQACLRLVCGHAGGVCTCWAAAGLTTMAKCSSDPFTGSTGLGLWVSYVGLFLSSNEEAVRKAAWFCSLQQAK